MKVLVATRCGQGCRPNDYFFAEEGEPVYLSLVCATDEDDPDGSCGCGRAFSGVRSHRATSTSCAVHWLGTKEEYVSLMAEGLSGALGAEWATPRLVEEAAQEMLELASVFPVGVVLERRGEIVQTRMV